MKKKHPILRNLLLDAAAAGLALTVFALFHHVLPNRQQSLNLQTLRPSTAQAATVQAAQNYQAVQAAQNYQAAPVAPVQAAPAVPNYQVTPPAQMGYPAAPNYQAPAAPTQQDYENYQHLSD